MHTSGHLIREALGTLTKQNLLGVLASWQAMGNNVGESWGKVQGTLGMQLEKNNTSCYLFTYQLDMELAEW